MYYVMQIVTHKNPCIVDKEKFREIIKAKKSREGKKR